MCYMKQGVCATCQMKQGATTEGKQGVCERRFLPSTTQHLIMMNVIVSRGGPLNRWVVWVNNDVPVWVSYIWVIMPS